MTSEQDIELGLLFKRMEIGWPGQKQHWKCLHCPEGASPWRSGTVAERKEAMEY